MDHLARVGPLARYVVAAKPGETIFDQGQLGPLGAAHGRRALRLAPNLDDESVALVTQTTYLLLSESPGALDPRELVVIGMTFGREHLPLPRQIGNTRLAVGDTPLEGIQPLGEGRGLPLDGKAVLQLRPSRRKIKLGLGLDPLACRNLDRRVLTGGALGPGAQLVGRVLDLARARPELRIGQLRGGDAVGVVDRGAREIATTNSSRLIPESRRAKAESKVFDSVL